MTEQETFDIVVKGILAQGRPSMAYGACRYRHTLEDGTVLKCSVGMLIPDHRYTSKIEGVSLGSYDFNEINTETLKNILKDEGHNFKLAENLQFAHDAAIGPNNQTFLSLFKEYARYIARRFNLSTAVLDSE